MAKSGVSAFPQLTLYHGLALHQFGKTFFFALLQQHHFFFYRAGANERMACTFRCCPMR
jgi:hypothetical protein